MKDPTKSERSQLPGEEKLRQEVGELKRLLEEKELQLLHLSEELEERTRIAEDLAAESQKFESLFERMDQGVVFQDAGGRIFQANPAAEQMLGLTKEQMQGRTSIDPRWKAIREDGSDFPGEQHPAMEALKSGRPVRHVVMGVYHPVQDSYRWILICAEPEFKADETIPFQVFTTFTDITGLKNSELEREESRRFMADLIENSRSLVYVKDLEGRYITVNRRWEEVAGVSRDSALYKTDDEIYEKESARIIARNDLQVLESGKIMEVEEALLIPSGVHYFLSVKFPVRDREGKVNGICGISMEVTDRKKIEMELRQSEEKYRSLIDSSDAAISMVDADGTYLYLNRIAAEPFGLSPEALTGSRVDQLMKPDHARQIMNDVRWVISANRGMVLEPEVDIAGERRWYRTSIQPVRDEKGNAFAVMIHAANITDNKLAEEELKKFRTISDQANYGTAIADLEGTLLYVNEAFARKHGWKPEELTGRNLFIVYNEEQKPRIQKLLSVLKSKGEFKTQEVWHTRKDGSVFPTLMTAKVINNDQNVPQFLSATVIDISEKKAQERKISQQNERLNAIINAMPDKIFVHDADGNFLEYYTHDPDKLLVPGEKLVGMNLRDVFEKDAAELNIQKIRECLRKQKLVMHEFSASAGGMVIHLEVRVVPMSKTTVLRFVRDITDKKISENQIIDLNINLERKVAQRTRELDSINKELIREVVERKKAEAELQEKTEELEKFFSVALDLLLIGDATGKFLKLNKSWKTTTGFSVEELQKLYFMDLVHPDDREETARKMNVLKNQKSIIGFTNRFRTKQGEYRNIEWHAVVVGDRIYAAARDVTNRIKLAQTLMENIDREKELSDMKSRFVSVASHEFRTPLAAIMMTGETLLNYWKRMDEEKIEARLKTIIDQVRHLGSIVSNVMQVSKIQEGKLSFESDEVELVTLCREVIHDFNVRYDNAIDLSSDFDEVWVKADRRLLLQSLTNLVSNSVKYAQPDPKVKVRLQVTEDHLLISVEDNGIGIPEADRQNLFQPFFRAGNASRIEGNGLGLNIVRESIRMHGGDVWFESRLNEGTVFYIQLPIALILK